MNIVHRFLAWIYFDVNPVPWTWTFIAILLVFIFTVRAIHYWPEGTTDDERTRQFELCMHIIGAVLWPIVSGIVIIYYACVGFVRFVRWCWPPEQRPSDPEQPDFGLVLDCPTCHTTYIIIDKGNWAHCHGERRHFFCPITRKTGPDKYEQIAHAEVECIAPETA